MHVSLIPDHIIDIPPSDKCGGMYTINIPYSIFKMVQLGRFELSPTTSIFYMKRKSP